MNPRLHAVARRLHRSALLRRLAKVSCRRLVLTQPFHGGVIAFNAVEHSWAWTGSRTYEGFDRPLQDRLLELSGDRPAFLDVGANVGAMTIGLLLRNPFVRALAVEPSPQAAALLRRSLRLNRLESRAEVLEMAAAAEQGRLRFDFAGSVTAHVAETGREVPSVSMEELVARASGGGRLLTKIDVEGFETALLPTLPRWRLPGGSCAVIELHPAGFNGRGDPEACVALLRGRSMLELRQLGGAALQTVDPQTFTQIEVHWR